MTDLLHRVEVPTLPMCLTCRWVLGIGRCCHSYRLCTKQIRPVSDTRYFRLLATSSKTQWQFEQYLKGRIHFGWSPPGTDLREIRKKPRSERTEQERITWRYTQFLLNRIREGDRLVLQFEQPLRQFVVAEVKGEYGFVDPPEDDFNHYLPCVPLTEGYIKTEHVPKHVRHDLSKRGHYFEIYPENTRSYLDELVEKRLWEQDQFETKRSVDVENEDTRSVVVQKVIETISNRWKGKDFESFVADLFSQVPGISVKDARDRGKGWDLTISITDPLTDAVVQDDVPVQCKNYHGKVRTTRPLKDLERSVRQSHENVRTAYLVIIGDLSDEYRGEIDRMQERLTTELEREISLHVVDQDRIAELYLLSLGRAGTET